jgi:hypothetical protein
MAKLTARESELMNGIKELRKEREDWQKERETMMGIIDRLTK